jgi:hypothetical protein
MAGFALRALVIAAAFSIGGCDGRIDNAAVSAAKGSITIKLPPPRQATAAPAFSFNARGSPGKDR